MHHFLQIAITQLTDVMSSPQHSPLKHIPTVTTIGHKFALWIGSISFLLYFHLDISLIASTIVAKYCLWLINKEPVFSAIETWNAHLYLVPQDQFAVTLFVLWKVTSIPQCFYYWGVFFLCNIMTQASCTKRAPAPWLSSKRREDHMEYVTFSTCEAMQAF